MRREVISAASMRLLLPMLCALLLLMPALAGASALRLSAEVPRLSLEGRLDHFVDAGGTLTFETVAQPGFVGEHFRRLPGYRSLGYDTDVHWFHVLLEPESGAPSRWVLAIGTPELEELDVWVAQADGTFRHHALGYHRPYENRPVRTRLFALPFDVDARTPVYFRVRTHNAIIVQAELWQVNAFTANETKENFYYGLYFGILLIAVVLYAILGARLRDVTMAAYAGYVGSQLLFHLGTTGYLPVLLENFHAEWLTDALPRIGWLGGAITIVLMWDTLLKLKQAHPYIHRLYLFTIVLNLGLLPFALMPFLVTAELLLVVKLANVLNVLNFFIGLVLLLKAWRQNRRAEWMIYFVAFVIPALGTMINTAANQGALPLNAMTSNLYLASVLVHVLVMSYGLALRLRQLQYDKVAAEQEVTVATRRAEEQRRFVAMLSHEFGNPLAAIDRAAQMVQIKLEGVPPAEQQRLAQIRTNAAILSGLVDNFLMTEALDHGALALSREPCDIRELLEGAIRLQGGPASDRIVLRECPATAFDLDSTLIGIALGNLLTNALRYSPPESPVEVSAQLHDTGLRIRIADRGPGLSDDELARLGTPYFRAASSLGKKGSGLGYHFTLWIVTAHGGTLTATSGEGAGLAVEMVLPP